MILIPAQIEGITSRKDRTVRINIGTQELSPDKAANLFSLNQKLCYVAIKAEDFQPEEIDVIKSAKASIESAKTPSQRLRAILYVNFQNNPEGYHEFQSYYLAKMDQVCNHFKNKLP